jgi:hypothetical protein
MCGPAIRRRGAITLALAAAGALVAASSLGAASALAAPAPRPTAAASTAVTTLVFCAPGSPGTTQEAQPAMDAFAAAVARRAAAPAIELAATYAASEDAGVARIRERDAGVALVSLPFFLKHEKALALRAAGLQPDLGGGGLERWTLVARRGKVSSPAALEGFTILSTAGYAPAFVRGPATQGFGPLPAAVKIAPTAAVLSALRRAASGEPVAVLLDGAQGAALPTLAFAGDLEVLSRSTPLPVGVVAVVEGRVAPRTWSQLERALRELHADAAGAAALDGIRMKRFEPLDAAALTRAREAFAQGAR